MPDGQAVDGTYNELWLDNPWTTQFRCKICPDAVGLQADIAVGDDWPDGAPGGEDDGWNVVIAHSAIGSEVLKACEADGDLLLRDIDIRYLETVQPHHVRLRRGVQARLDGCSAAGLPEPNFINLALAECAEQLTAEEQGRNFEGTVARLSRGGHLDVDDR
jgi:coenzyme F420 hydrogenase subunit beta